MKGEGTVGGIPSGAGVPRGSGGRSDIAPAPRGARGCWGPLAMAAGSRNCGHTVRAGRRAARVAHHAERSKKSGAGIPDYCPPQTRSHGVAIRTVSAWGKVGKGSAGRGPRGSRRPLPAVSERTRGSPSAIARILAEAPAADPRAGPQVLDSAQLTAAERGRPGPRPRPPTAEPRARAPGRSAAPRGRAPRGSGRTRRRPAPVRGSR